MIPIGGTILALTALEKAWERDQAVYQGQAQSLTTRLTCGQPARLEVTVRQGSQAHDELLSDALVEVDEAGLWAYTTDQGMAVFTVPAGRYTVRAKKDWFLPEAGRVRNDVQVRAGQTHRVTLRLGSMEFHLHLDADRDGQVDGTRRGAASWRWGPNELGAIVMVNSDDDDQSGQSDAADQTVNGNGDVPDLAPLDLRRIGRSQAPASWRVTLSVDPADAARLRIFDTRTGMGQEIVGPNAGASHSWSELQDERLELGMEALQYPHADFDGEILLTLEVSRPETGYASYFRARKSYREAGRVRVAPWIADHHLAPPQELYVVDDQTSPAQQQFLQDLQQLVPNNVQVTTTQINDKWLQDCMEIGHSRVPAAHRVPVVLKIPRIGGLAQYPRTLRGPDVGYWDVGQDEQSTFSAGGNLETTPPAKEPDGLLFRGREFPLGRIYYCSGRGRASLAPNVQMADQRMSAGLEGFLEAQKVQEPIDLDVSWLVVGHVDEVVSFVPAASNDPLRRFNLLIASPRRAFAILSHLNTHGNGNQILLPGRTGVPLTVQSFLANGIPNVYTADEYREANDACQEKLDAILDTLQEAIDIPHVIEVPVIFQRMQHLPNYYEALTGDMVNMIVLGDRCIIPRAYGPGPTALTAQPNGNHARDQFETYLATQLGNLNLTAYFIDTWDAYHVTHGEAHCATNVRRGDYQAQPPWWEFPG